MRFEHDGITLWLEPDEYMGPETSRGNANISVTVGVEPADASNRVELRYRVNRGPISKVTADAVRHAGRVQYFRAKLPGAAFRAGDTVEYAAVCHCVGRQVPSPDDAEQFQTSCQVLDGSKTGMLSIRAVKTTVSPAETAVRAYDSIHAKAQQDVALGASLLYYVVEGQVRAEGIPAVGVLVQVFDKSLRTDRFLGEAVTDAAGHYGVHYAADQFQNPTNGSKGKASLLFRAFADALAVEIAAVTVGGASLAEPKIIFNAPAEVLADLVVVLPTPLSEYERCVAKIKPTLGAVALGDVTDADVAFLVGKTGLEGTQIEWLRGAGTLGRETGLPAEAFYGWARQKPPLPLDWLNWLRSPDSLSRAAVLKSVLDKLTAASRDVLSTALYRAVDQNILSVRLRGTIDEIVHRLKRRGDIARRFTGQLVNKNTGAPLARVTVRAFDLDSGAEPEDLGAVVTNAQGQFEIGFVTAPDAVGDRRLRLKAFKGANELLAAEVQVKPGQKNTIQVPITIAAAHEPPEQLLPRLASTLRLELPPKLLSTLSSQGVNTLGDIRKTGVTSQLEELSTQPDHPAVKVLQAHADLSRLQPDVPLNAFLIDKGFRSVAAIAETPRATFVGAVQEIAGDARAAKIHASARAQTAFLDNVATGMLVNGENGLDTDAQEDVQDRTGRCGCKNCEAAVSPAAYLADMTKYALNHLKNGSQSITLRFLENSFHQPFSALPLFCGAVDTPINQVRICIEIVRSYLQADAPSPAQREALTKAEREYCIAAYTLLLNKIGCTYEEVRLARTNGLGKRQALADRLGLDLSAPRSPVDELDRLLLEPGNMTEVMLERLFGLVDTVRNPLSDGVKIGDLQGPAAQVTDWSLDGVIWNRTTDQDGVVFISLKNARTVPVPFHLQVNLYRDRPRTELVASGSQFTPAGTLQLAQQNGSGLSGVLNIAYSGDSDSIEIAAIPLFLSWRLRHLRSIWQQQDWPADAYTEGLTSSSLKTLPPGIQFPQSLSDSLRYDAGNQSLTFSGVMRDIDRTLLVNLASDTGYRASIQRLFVNSQRPPIIDPDLIGPDDFRTPVTSDAGFAIWLKRRAWVDERITALASLTKTVNGAPALDWDLLLASMYKPAVYNGVSVVPWVTTTQPADFNALRNNLVNGQDIQAVTERIQADLLLTVEDFTRLIALQDKDRLAGGNSPNATATDEERGDAVSILTQATKRAMFGGWRQEEQSVSLLLGSHEFWISLAQPLEGEWPPTPTIDLPRIDPDAVPLVNLPELPTGKAATTLWRTRQSELATVRQALRFAAHGSSGFETMLTVALGPSPAAKTWLFTLAVLRTSLADLNQAVADNAKKTVTDDLHLTLTNFNRLMELGSREGDPDPSKHASVAEWDELCNILVQMYKGSRRPTWLLEETQAGIDVAYWTAVKARLPRWRSTPEARQSWQQALRARSQRPIIDPDLVGPQDFRDPLRGPASELWMKAQTDLTQAASLGLCPDTLTAFDAVLFKAGLKGLDLVDLDAERTRGNGIDARIEQLSLTYSSFSYLIRLRGLIENNLPVLDSEWENAVSILVQVQKVRRFALWRSREQEQRLSLSPDFFRVPDPPAVEFPPKQPDPLTSWRFSSNDRRDWQDMLQSRIDQQTAVIQNLKDAVDAVEEALLPTLRDALLMAMPAQGNADLDAQATWVTNRLCVDAKAGGCTITTRVSQALETIQGVLYAVRTGQPILEFRSEPAVVSWGLNRLDVFVRGFDDALWHQWFDGTWHDWESRGGVLTSGPAVSSWADGRLDVFARGENGDVQRLVFDGGWAASWERLGGAVTSAPAAVSWGKGRIDVFALGAGNDMQHAYYNDKTQWSGWESLGGVFTSGPAVSSWADGRLDVFARDKNGDVQHLVFDGGWAASWEALGGAVTSAPAAASWGQGRIDLFARGTSNDLQHSYYPYQSGWSGWESLGGVLTSGPAVSSWVESRLDIFARGPSNDLLQKSFQPGWSGWRSLPFRPLTLVAESFDEEWKWIGSYATWRAAMFVFLYPENILLPTLRPDRWQTPTFRDLVQTLPSVGRLTPDAACAAAQIYSDYFADVCNLWVEATCQTQAVGNKGTGCQRASASVPHNLFYMFARGGQTNKVYWSAYDPEDLSGSGYEQTFWREVRAPGQGQETDKAQGADTTQLLNRVIRLIGAVPYRAASGKRYVCLFVQTLESGAQHLVLVKFNLDTATWDAPTPLTVPKDASRFLAIVKQDTYEGNPPQIGFQLASGEIYSSALDREGAGWSGDPVLLPSYPPPFRLVGMVGTGQNPVLVLHNQEAQQLTFLWQGQDLGGARLVPAVHGLVLLPRTATMPGDRGQVPGDYLDSDLSCFALVDYSGDTTQVGAKSIPDIPWFKPPYSGIADVDDVVATNGPVSATSSRQFVYQYRFAYSGTVGSQEGRGKIRRLFNVNLRQAVAAKTQQVVYAPTFYRCTFGFSETGPSVASQEAIAPGVAGPLDIPGQLSAAALQERRQLIKEAFDGAAGAPPSSLTYLEEAYYFVPMHLALQLQRSGQFAAALDWFRTVYDYIAPESDRKIYQGLEAETGLDSVTFSRLGNWLQDPLNPHSIAAARVNTYTRFTVLSIIRCLLDYADSEFSQDDAESLPRARRLYQNALDLLDLPVLRQHLNQCEDVIGSLDRGHVEQTSLSEQASRPTRTTLATALDQSVRAKALLYGSAAADQSVFKALQALSPAGDLENTFVPSIPLPGFCVPANPVLGALRLHASLNLYKIRTCRNIAGMERQVEPYAASADATSGMPVIGGGGQLILPGVATLHPTLYRYPILIERAKQLVQLAEQLEGQMLSALEKRDAEQLAVLRARQEVNLMQASLRLQDLRITEAEGQVKLATLQQERAQIQVTTYDEWLRKGANQYEKEMISAYQNVAGAQKGAAEASRRIQLKQAALSAAQLAATIAQAGVVGAAIGLTVGAADFGVDAVLIDDFSEDSKKAIDSTLSAQVASVNAALERRQDEWQLQQQLAGEDLLIGKQQEQIANDHVDVVKQDKAISVIQASNAKDTVEFLTNKFTNVDLYDWMSGVLEGVYSKFLQWATVMAKLAETQLAFERQEVPPSYIKSDYWDASADNGSAAGAAASSPDRRGLTGSARLLQDIYQLDLYAFERNKRKLQLTKTISLARLAPPEFQQFRETGVMMFATPMEMFDRGFPGHYLRLIKRVRTSVIALIPPTQGIHATLSTGGVSRVVIGGEMFQTVPIRRDPEFVAFSSPNNSTGLFELEPQSDMLLPFEGSGVEMTWEFVMPKAANLMDYRTIADVLITMEYTALNSFDYRQQVIQSLKPRISADRPFSFRNQFADQWYDLHNPDQTSTPMVVDFTTVREDFPPNMDGLKIEQLLVYFARVDGQSFEVPVTALNFTETGGSGTVGGAAITIDGAISTRRGNAGSWTSMIGKVPVGGWLLEFPKSEEVKDWFRKERIEDILLVVTYSGRTPDWPA